MSNNVDACYFSGGLGFVSVCRVATSLVREVTSDDVTSSDSLLSIETLLSMCGDAAAMHRFVHVAKDVLLLADAVSRLQNNVCFNKYVSNVMPVKSCSYVCFIDAIYKVLWQYWSLSISLQAYKVL